MRAITYEEKKAIQKFMANRKRQLNHVARSYPKYREGMTTAQYIVEFSRVNAKHTVNLLAFDYASLWPKHPEAF